MIKHFPSLVDRKIAFYQKMLLHLYLHFHRVFSLRVIQDRLQRASASVPRMLCVFGTISEESRNRLWIYLNGEPIAHYDKVHLFGPNNEFEMWQPGDRYAVLVHDEWRIGLGICNDVRFSEQPRQLKLKYDINMMVYPAVWPWERDQIWAALLKARAIENGVFTIGCCIAGIDNGAERFDGAGNHVFDPLGTELFPQDRTYEIDQARLSDVLIDTRKQYCEINQFDCFGE